MIIVQGVAINSRSAAGPIATKGDPFLPMAVNVSGKKDKPRWESLRVFAREEAQLRRLRELVAERKSVVVKTVAEVFASVYERNGEARAGVSFSANLRQVMVFDNERREWVKLAALIGGDAVEAAGDEESEVVEEPLPF